MKFMYKQFSFGNKRDIPWIEKELKKRNINYSLFNIKTGFLFQISDNELKKLPTDKKGSYLGNNSKGFTMYRIDDNYFQELLN